MKLPTIRLNLANFRAYASSELEKFATTVEIQPSDKHDEKRFMEVKDVIKIIRLAYWEDGANRNGVQVFHINPEIYHTLKNVLLFPNMRNDSNKIKIKYRNLTILPSDDVSAGEVFGK